MAFNLVTQAHAASLRRLLELISLLPKVLLNMSNYWKDNISPPSVSDVYEHSSKGAIDETLC